MNKLKIWRYRFVYLLATDQSTFHNNVEKLKNIEKSFEKIVFNSRNLVDKSGNDRYRGGTSATVDVDELINYSRLIASTTTAGFVGQYNYELFKEPRPQEQQFVTGILYKASGCEATAEVEKEENKEPIYNLDINTTINQSPDHDQATTEINLEPTGKIDEDTEDIDDIIWD